MSHESFVADVLAELRRIGLDPAELQTLAVQGDPASWLAKDGIGNAYIARGRTAGDG